MKCVKSAVAVALFYAAIFLQSPAQALEISELYVSADTSGTECSPSEEILRSMVASKISGRLKVSSAQTGKLPQLNVLTLGQYFTNSGFGRCVWTIAISLQYPGGQISGAPKGSNFPINVCSKVVQHTSDVSVFKTVMENDLQKLLGQCLQEAGASLSESAAAQNPARPLKPYEQKGWSHCVHEGSLTGIPQFVRGSKNDEFTPEFQAYIDKCLANIK